MNTDEVYNSIMLKLGKVVKKILNEDFLYANDYVSDGDEAFDIYLESFDINTISLKLRRKAYIDYEEIFNFYNRNCRDYLLDEHLEYNFNESIQSQNIAKTKKLVKRLKEEFSAFNFQFKAYSPHKVQIVEIDKIPNYRTQTTGMLVPIIRNNVKIIDEEFKLSGYYKIREREYTDNEGMKWIWLVYDPIRQDSITELIRKNTFIYHSSLPHNHESIIKNGLIAKNEQKDFRYNEPRVYFSIDGKNDFNYISMMQGITNARRRNNPNFDGKYICYFIKTDRLPKNIEFFEDPHGTNCIYCKCNIPPEAIFYYEEIEF